MSGSASAVQEVTEALPRYFTLHESAEVAGVCYQTVWRYVKRHNEGKPGGLRAVRRGSNGNWRVSEADLLEWAFDRNGSSTR